MAFFVDRCPSCGVMIAQRTQGQNSALHALCADLAAQVSWPRGSGVKISETTWKRLLISAWERAQGRAAEFFPAIDGHGFDVVYRRSSRLAKSEMAELLLFGDAWAAENGVRRTVSKRQQREAAEQEALERAESSA